MIFNFLDGCSVLSALALSGFWTSMAGMSTLVRVLLQVGGWQKGIEMGYEQMLREVWRNASGTGSVPRGFPWELRYGGRRGSGEQAAAGQG